MYCKCTVCGGRVIVNDTPNTEHLWHGFVEADKCHYFKGDGIYYSDPDLVNRKEHK